MAVAKQEAANSPALESIGVMTAATTASNINGSSTAATTLTSTSLTSSTMQDNHLQLQHQHQQQAQQVNAGGNCCASCRMPIKDRFIFSVIEQNFHQDCVRCVDCLSNLNDRCYAYEGKLYCRLDYWRRFGPKCSACQESIKPDELVQRLRDNLVYHLSCFVCQDCKRHLRAGEQLHLIDERRLLCKRDFMITTNVDPKPSAGAGDANSVRMGAIDSQSSSEPQARMAAPNQQDENSHLHHIGRGHHQHLNQHHQLMPSADVNCAASDDGDDSALLDDDHLSSNGADGDQSPQSNLNDGPYAGQYVPLSKGGGHMKNSPMNQDSNQKLAGDEREGNGPRRGPRTTIKPDQLDTLRRAFAQTPKPSRHVREQLANETHLNMRVIQVWFQNRRSKERRMKNSNGCLRRMNFARRRNHTADSAARKGAAAAVGTPTANSAPVAGGPLAQQSLMASGGGGGNRTSAAAAGGTQQQSGGMKQEHSPMDSKDQLQLLSGGQQQASANNRQSHNSPSEFGGSSSGGFTYFSDSSNQGDAFAINSSSGASQQQQQQYLLGQDQPQTTLMTLESPSNGATSNNNNNGQRPRQQQQYQPIKSDQTPPQPQQAIYPPQQHMMMTTGGPTQMGAGHRGAQQHHQLQSEPTLGLLNHPNQGASVVQW